MKHDQLNNQVRKVIISIIAAVFCLGLLLPAAMAVPVSAANPTTTTLTVSKNPVFDGQSINLTAAVTPSGATGTILFLNDGTTILDNVTLTSGTATKQGLKLSVGRHTITAQYQGADNYTASTSHSIIVSVYPDEEGYVWAWGANNAYQLGMGISSTSDQDIPVPVKNSKDGETTLGDASLIALAAGGAHSLALSSYSDTLYSWGDNSEDQLGRDIDKSEEKRYGAVVELDGGIGDIIQISAGYEYNLLLDDEGHVWAWGDNSKGQLGIGSYQNQKVTQQVLGPEGTGFLNDIINISAGHYHSLAVRSDGTVWAWGYNNKGQLGNGTDDDSGHPVQVSGLSDVITVAAGQYHSIALKKDGTVWSWGNNTKGQLGDSSDDDSSSPVEVDVLEDIIAIAAGQNHNLALEDNGNVWAWGDNSNGQLGISGTTKKDSPVQVREGQQDNDDSSSLENIISIAAGNEHSMALDDNGYVYAWGNNGDGQLGNNSTDIDSRSTVPVRTDEFDKDSKNGGAKLIAAGGNHSLALYDTNLYISTTSLGKKEKGDDFNIQLKVARGDKEDEDEDEDFDWELIDESEDDLEDIGLELESDGEIHGEVDGDEEDYYFTFRATDESNYSVTRSLTFTISEESSSGGGSGGGSSWNTVSLTGFTSPSTVQSDDDGYSRSSYLLTSTDSNITLSIPSDTLMENSAGNRLSSLTCVVSAPQVVPVGSAIVKSYSLGPDGAKFYNNLTLTFKYGTITLPAGVAESGLYLAYYNKSSGQWDRLNGTLNTGAKTISVNINHFSYYALMGTLSSTTTTTTSTTTTTTTTPSTTTKPTSTTSTTTTGTSTSPATTTSSTTQTTTPSEGENEPRSTNWPVIIIIVLVVILAALAVLIILRRRRKTH